MVWTFPGRTNTLLVLPGFLFIIGPGKGQYFKMWKKFKGKYYSQVIIILSAVLIFSQESIYYWLFPPGKKYGMAFNEERKQLGIATLPANWETKDKYSETKMWHPPVNPASGAFRSSKTVIVNDDGEITYDGDIYLRLNNGQQENLVVGYKFGDKGGWECKYYSSSLQSRALELTKEQADSVIQNWGIKGE